MLFFGLSCFLYIFKTLLLTVIQWLHFMCCCACSVYFLLFVDTYVCLPLINVFDCRKLMQDDYFHLEERQHHLPSDQDKVQHRVSAFINPNTQLLLNSIFSSITCVVFLSLILIFDCIFCFVYSPTPIP